LRQGQRVIAPHAPLSHLGDVRDRHLQAGDDVQRQTRDRLVELLLRDDRRPGLGAPGVVRPGEPQHRLVTLFGDFAHDLAHPFGQLARSRSQLA